VLRERRAIDPDSKNMWRATASAGALGLEIAVSIVIGTGIGYYLDLKLKTNWIMYVGFFVGIGAAIKALVRVTRAAKKAFPDDKDGNGKPGGNGAGPN
jgi:F0F1-type ATP synthase assembly protein I